MRQQEDGDIKPTKDDMEDAITATIFHVNNNNGDVSNNNDVWDDSRDGVYIS